MQGSPGFILSALLGVVSAGCGATGESEIGGSESTAASATDGSTSGHSTGSTSNTENSGSDGTSSSSEGETAESETSDATETFGETEDSSTGGPSCTLPDTLAPGLIPVQQEIVARLAGAEEVSPGVVLSDRASFTNRTTTVDYLVGVLEAMDFEVHLHSYSPSGTNIYVGLEATVATSETGVIGAHFDSVSGSPGANDNATGVAMVLSLGSWLAQLPCREQNVILVLLDQEELNLLGSQAFAAWLLNQPMEVTSVHTIDQMGWDSDGDRAVELERADPGLFELYEEAEPFAPGMTPLIATNTGFTDHVAFRDAGFEAIGLTEEFVSGDTTPHYHLPSDTYETVNFNYLASSTALLRTTIGRLLSPEP